jgi:hypothetical protein
VKLVHIESYKTRVPEPPKRDGQKPKSGPPQGTPPAKKLQEGAIEVPPAFFLIVWRVDF